MKCQFCGMVNDTGGPACSICEEIERKRVLAYEEERRQEEDQSDADRGGEERCR